MVVRSDAESVFSLSHIMHASFTTTDYAYQILCCTCEVIFHSVPFFRGVTREAVSTVDQLAGLTSFTIAGNAA